MAFLSGDHKRAWEGLGEVRAAAHVDRDGMMMDAEAAYPPDFDLVAARSTGEGLLVELTWREDGESTIEQLDAAMYGYIARLSYDDVLIARRTSADEVRYLVATGSEDRRLGQMITVVVGGARTEKTLATYHKIRGELGGG